MKKRPHFYYVVALPQQLKIDRMHKVTYLELVLSTSNEGAVSHALSRKVSENLLREIRQQVIGHAMNVLRLDFGGVSNYAFKIPEDIWEENGKKLSFLDSNYKLSQKGFLANEIATKRGGNELDHLETAQKYLEFYNQRKPSNYFKRNLEK